MPRFVASVTWRSTDFSRGRIPDAWAMDARSAIVVHGQANGICTECGAPLKWAERAISPDKSIASQVYLVCKNNHRVLDALAISSLAASFLS